MSPTSTWYISASVLALLCAGAAAVTAIAAATALSPSINWYTNTNLENNQRIYEIDKSLYSGFYFCCGKFEFAADGTFVFNNSSALIKNINYFRNKVSTIYIHGGIESEAVFNVPLNKLQKQFDAAAKIAKEINIDGFLVDYEPHSDDKSLAVTYTTFLHEFEKELAKTSVHIGCDIAGWGILDYFEKYADADLNIYTSMTPTYNGDNMTHNKEYVNQELKYIHPNKLRTGIGSMLVKYPPSNTWNFNWTESKLNKFLDFLKTGAIESVPSVDIWRADLDANGYDTQPWFYQCLKDFMK